MRERDLTISNLMACNRHMAWERAKGELRSMFTTFYGEMDKYERLEAEVELFVSKIESEGLHE